MGKENEITILDINPKEVVKRLKDLKAKPIGKYKFKRIEFLLKGSVRGGHSWGRVRSDGKETTITIKEMIGKGGYSSMNEYEIKTNNFEDTVKLITKLINSKLILYFENEREAYLLGNALITIDKWPKIPAFMEIEAQSMSVVKNIYKQLKIKGKFAGNSTIHNIYKLYHLDFRKVMKKNAPKLKKLISEKNSN